MPLVKLTIKHEPVDVDEHELASLRQQGLVEKVLDEPAPEAGKPSKTPAASAPADGKEQQ